MNEIDIRKTGCAGRITLDRPKALNALTYQMCLEIEAALDAWRDDDQVKLVVIDAAGEKAFCAGGDLAEMYSTAMKGDFGYGRKFWADEYRLNAKIFNFPKPYIAFMQGFTMGGGVGVSCHGSHRIVCDSSRIAMPECGIGLAPDVGGTLLLGRAPGRLGEYIGTTGTRMGPGDAILAEFADYYVPEIAWPDLIAELERSGDHEAVDRAAKTPPASDLAGLREEIDRHFAGETIGDLLRSLAASTSDFTVSAHEALRKMSPLSVACTIELVHRARAADSIERALAQEYRFTWRSAEEGDFIEGIRAAIIEKDRNPRWRHARIEDVTASEVSRMLMPLGDNELQLQGDQHEDRIHRTWQHGRADGGQSGEGRS